MFDRWFKRKRRPAAVTSHLTVASPRDSLGSAVSFGDTVRIVSSPETEERGLAGRIGTVFGETTPSSSRVAVVGVLSSDYAANVFFDDLDEGFWFEEGLIEFVDHGAGTEVRLDGVDKRWVRDANGNWVEFDAD